MMPNTRCLICNTNVPNNDIEEHKLSERHLDLIDRVMTEKTNENKQLINYYDAVPINFGTDGVILSTADLVNCNKLEQNNLYNINVPLCVTLISGQINDFIGEAFKIDNFDSKLGKMLDETNKYDNLGVMIDNYAVYVDREYYCCVITNNNTKYKYCVLNSVRVQEFTPQYKRIDEEVMFA